MTGAVNKNSTVLRSVALVDGTTILINCDTTEIATVTLGGNRTLSNPTGTPYNGQVIEVWITQDGTGSRTLALDTAYGLGSDIASVTLSATAGKTDLMLLKYRAAASKWYVVSLLRGY